MAVLELQTKIKMSINQSYMDSQQELESAWSFAPNQQFSAITCLSLASQLRGWSFSQCQSASPNAVSDRLKWHWANAIITMISQMSEYSTLLHNIHMANLTGEITYKGIFSSTWAPVPHHEITVLRWKLCCQKKKRKKDLHSFLLFNFIPSPCTSHQFLRSLFLPLPHRGLQCIRKVKAWPIHQHELVSMNSQQSALTESILDVNWHIL